MSAERPRRISLRRRGRIRGRSTRLLGEHQRYRRTGHLATRGNNVEPHAALPGYTATVLKCPTLHRRSAPAVRWTTPSHSFVIGACGGLGESTFFNGLVDKVRLYNRVITAYSVKREFAISAVRRLHAGGDTGVCHGICRQECGRAVSIRQISSYRKTNPSKICGQFLRQCANLLAKPLVSLSDAEN